MNGGLIVAAPASGSGKTVVTLGLIRALKNAGRRVASLKIGPDYIDADFHRIAGGGACRNYDPWGMRAATLDAQASALAEDCEVIVAEGVMGLFDGAADGSGSTADAALALGWPIVLVVDVKGQGASAAATIEGFRRHRADTDIAGVIFNRVGGERHERLLRRAAAPLGVPVIGCVPRHPDLELPSRHLGLVQARERADMETWIQRAAEIIGGALDMDAIADLAAAAPGREHGKQAPAPLPAPIPAFGAHIAIAADDAFAFTYTHLLDGWQAAGARLGYFSPLADQAPDAAADGVFLPGGYPELHAAKLAGNETFLDGLRQAAARGAAVYGECGGFMVLGESLTDAGGAEHRMAGLLPVKTSFAERRLHLGYRRLRLIADGPLGAAGEYLRGHEFHYASLTETQAEPLFGVFDAEATALGDAGGRAGSVLGSFIHLLDRE
ncbi:MAG: cobyrinic acid a,c-diamide synthase [Rhodospirillaceae bacterium]|nr:cobyrinic acid a,c-diamide synthase [Rhodospirillaceae bacterium]MDP6645600.1 cobyrinate a,c-diamide synthase [Rhodospirillales bacterium]